MKIRAMRYGIDDEGDVDGCGDDDDDETKMHRAQTHLGDLRCHGGAEYTNE